MSLIIPAPVVRELPADLETPVSVYLKLSGQGPSFLLESVTGGERIGRYSFLGAEPRAILRATRNSVETVCGGETTRRESDDPLRDIEEFLADSRPVRVPGLDCFAGGWKDFWYPTAACRTARKFPDAWEYRRRSQ